MFGSYQIRGSIVVSISACHAEDPGSIPGRGISLLRGDAMCGVCFVLCVAVWFAQSVVV